MTKRRAVFVLRLWTESPAMDATFQAQLRGSLQPVDAEQTYYFASWDQMIRILTQVLEWRDGTVEQPSTHTSQKE